MKRLPSLFAGMILGILLSARAMEPQGNQDIPMDYRNQIIRNTQLLEDLQRNVRDLQEWHNQHSRDDLLAAGTLAAQLREHSVTLAAHERLLWVIILAVVGMLIKVLADLISGRRPRRNGNGNGNGNHRNNYYKEET